jgi:hypothetical protein
MLVFVAASIVSLSKKREDILGGFAGFAFHRSV